MIRHGRTEANERRLYCGASDLPLSEGGRADLRALRARGGYPESGSLLKISSGMRRTDETMRLLFGAEPDVRIAAFREMNFGRFELHSYEQLKADADYQAWISDEAGEVSTPGGESSQAFRARVFASADAIGSDALVLCHGGVIAALMERWFPLEGKNMYAWQPDFGHGYVVEWSGGQRSYHSIPAHGM